MRVFLLTLSIISALMMPVTAGASSTPTHEATSGVGSSAVPAGPNDSGLSNTESAATAFWVYIPDSMTSGNTAGSNQSGNPGSGSFNAPVTPTPAASSSATS